VILFVEIIASIYGLYSLISGKFVLSSKKIILGYRARILGIFFVLIPLFIIMASWISSNISVIIFNNPINTTISFFVELTIFISIFSVVIYIGNKFYINQLKTAEELPSKINCFKCGIELELETSEMRTKIFTCPNCSTNFDFKTEQNL